MVNKEFNELIRKRKDWVRSSRENNFDFDSILAGLYTDPSHFIYELLQNAEDEGAKEIGFELLEDELDVYHNGKDFDLQDIDGVTGIGISKKKEDLNLIGKFGVGFKSVFAVTQNPEIFSGEYNIKIENFVIPTPLEVVSAPRKNGTLIRIPFNHKYRSKEEIFELTNKRLENLELKTLLFLKNIKEIKWQTPSSNGYYLKDSKSIQGKPNANRVTLVSSSVTEEYLVIEKQIEIDNKELKVEVAYKLGKDQNSKEIIVSEPNSKLVVFFPTEKDTFLNFIIQGPFKTTPNRENIPLGDEQNKKILEDIGDLIAESMNLIKNLGYIETNFLSMLPLRSDIAEREQIYSVIYKKVKEKFLFEKLLPTSDGTYTKAGDALLAKGEELTEFLNSDDIMLLFSKRHWLVPKITKDRTPELRKYLMNELKVIEIDFKSFAEKITAEFLQSKSDEWMIDFYMRLLVHPSLWKYSNSDLRTKPIIRLENNEHIAPFDNKGKIQVYLPAETKSRYKTVKRALTEKEESKRFLKELGLEKPDLFAEIREIILHKYQKENPIKDEWYFEDFEKFLRGYKSIQSSKKEEFVKELSDTSFIYAVKNDNTEEGYLLKASKIYFPDDDLKNYFNGYQQLYFVSKELFEKFGDEQVRKFLKELGVEDKPRRIQIKKVADLPSEDIFNRVGNTGRNVWQYDFDYEGLDNILDGITIEKSHLIWKLLLKNIGSLSSWQAKEFFNGKRKWVFQKERSERIDAKFLITLKQHAWLVDRNNNFKKPSEITFSKLSDNYLKENPNIDILKKVLGFKPEIIEQLPENDRRILEIARQRNITPDELEKLLNKREEKTYEQGSEQWQPECEPEAIYPEIQEIEPDKIVTVDLSGQTGASETNEGKDNEDEDEGNDGKKNEMKKTTIDTKAIGKWGEKFVYNNIKRKYEKQGKIIETYSGFKVIKTDGENLEIIWLNKYQDRGKGYDIVIKENETEIEYIEVKTKTKDEKELIEVSGTQWEFARKLFDQNEGEKYSFYVVSKAGKKNAGIYILRNPIKHWKEGKLYAHPVNFKL